MIRKNSIVLLAFLGCMGLSSIGEARQKELGLGIVLGDPTGFTGNYYLGPERSIDFTFAFDLGRAGDSFFLMVDYLIHKPNSIGAGDEKLGWYWGVGAFLWSWNREQNIFFTDDDIFAVGPRVLGGINYDFEDPSIEVYGEVGFGMSIVPAVYTDLTIGIGGRYYF